MTKVAVLGAGAGGLSSSVELAQAGHDVLLWNRNAATLAPYATRKVPYEGVLGQGSVEVRLVTTDLATAVGGADVVVVSLPAFAHPALFAELARLRCPAPVVLSPGHTGGALHMRQVFQAKYAPLPPVAELSTLPYVARVRPDGTVGVTGRAHRLRCGSLPDAEEATKVAAHLFSCALDATDVLASSLSNVNLVLHPPGAVLAAAWVEATQGDFTFYVDAMTPAVTRVLEELDGERRDVASRFGHELPSLVEEMARVGTVPADLPPGASTADAIRSGEANRYIKAPSSLQHRYYKEDFAFGLVPFLALAAVAGAAVPVAGALAALGRAMLGEEIIGPALDAQALGIDGLELEGLLRLVRG
jgi:opine dehydrogenase